MTLTCNQVPWSQFEKESKPLQNRMFVHKDLVKFRVLTSRSDHLRPDPRFYQEVFSYIRSEVIPRMEWPPSPGDLDWFYATDLISDFVIDKCNTGTMTLKNVIDNAGLDGGLERKYYGDGISSSGRLTDVDVGFYGYQEGNGEMMNRILAWLWVIQQNDSVDHYWSFEDFKKPRLVNSMRKDDYDPEVDMDEEDYRTMKGGHALISRLLLRIRDWPHFSDKDFSVDQQKKFMIRTCLLNMSGVLKFMITAGKEWSSTRLLDVVQECLFAQGIVGASTPKNLKRKRNEIDELETMTVSPIELAKRPRTSNRLCLRKKKLPIRRRLDFGNHEKSFEAKKWEPEPDEILKNKGISPKAAKDLLDYAYSGNQECYHKVEEETGVAIDQLADYAASDSPQSEHSSGYTDFESTWVQDRTLT